jgi:hypothetical protein
MSKKHKPPKKSAANVIDFCLPEQPHGEDFFVFAVILDDPSTLTWDIRHTVFGTWAQSKNAAGRIVNLWANSKPNGQLRLAMFQGERARDYLKESFHQELRYQQERIATPNN